MSSTSPEPGLPDATTNLRSPGDIPAPSGRFLVLYGTPTDRDAFEEHYLSVHVPLAKRLPGLRRYAVSRNVTTIRGDDTTYLVAELEWDSIESLRAAFASPEGRATAADMAHLAALSTVRSVVLGDLEVL
jgi:uncharacterized protein (TIGR02118 family)